jgi:hypothetical protein
MLVPFSFMKTGGYDADAQAFFDRVTTAGGTLSTTEKTATNQLVLDMKAAGIWSAMRAVYPMVGASAAACAQNLKSSSFTGTFTSGWTFASTGVTGNGTSSYFDTGLNLNTMNSINDISFGIYNRTNSQNRSSFGWDYPNALATLVAFYIKYTDGNKYGYIFDSANDGGSVANPEGFNAMSRTASTTKFIQLNSTVTTYSSLAIGTLSSRNFIFGAGSQAFDNRSTAFGFIANGLTSTNLSDFYTAVQAFQTTLSRNV